MLTYAMYCPSFKIPDMSSQLCACQQFRYVFQLDTKLRENLLRRTAAEQMFLTCNQREAMQ